VELGLRKLKPARVGEDLVGSPRPWHRLSGRAVGVQWACSARSGLGANRAPAEIEGGRVSVVPQRGLQKGF
jgi:hypothetical protein